MVVGVMGVLLAFTLPASLRYMNSSRLTGASNQLATDIHYARSLANTERRTYRIVFNSTSYVVSRVSPAAILRTRALPRGVTIAVSDTAMFYPWGLTDPITITVTNDRGAQHFTIATNGTFSHG